MNHECQMVVAIGEGQNDRVPKGEVNNNHSRLETR